MAWIILGSLIAALAMSMFLMERDHVAASITSMQPLPLCPLGGRAVYRCDLCHEEGEGDPDDLFAHEEAEHCLHGCHGSLRLVHVIRPGLPPGPPVRYVRQ
jgi:hypothetical protein